MVKARPCVSSTVFDIEGDGGVKICCFPFSLSTTLKPAVSKPRLRHSSFVGVGHYTDNRFDVFLIDRLPFTMSVVFSFQ